MNRDTKRYAVDVLVKESVHTLFSAVLITYMISSFAGLIDHFFASSFVGVSGVAAIGLVSPVGNLIWILLQILAEGSQIIIGKRLGRGDTAAGTEIFSSTLLLMLVSGILAGILLYVFAVPLALFLGASGAVLPDITAYLRGLVLNVPCLLLYETLVEFVPFVGGEKKLVASVGVITVSDAVLNVVFVKQLGLGMFGLGLATSVSELLGLAVLVPMFLQKDRCFVFRPGTKGMKYMKEAAAAGLPGGLFEVCNFILPVCVNHLMMRYAGVEAVSAMAVAGSIRSFLKSFNFAEGDICRSVGSVYYGERAERSLIDTVRDTLKEGSFYYGITALVTALFAKKIIPLFSGGSEAVERLAYPAVLLTLVHLLLMAVYMVIIRVYQVQGKEKLVSRLNLAVYFVIPLFYAVSMIPFLGAWGLWLSWIAADLTVLAGIYLLNRTKKKGPVTPGDIITYGDRFGLPPEKKLLFSVNTAEDAAAASGKIREFCLGNGSENRKADCAASSSRELCENIIEHGNRKGKKPRISLTVFFLDDAIHIRIKDDLKVFNPVEHAEKIREGQTDDMAMNSGLRLAASMAKEMNYSNLFHMNVVEIVL